MLRKALSPIIYGGVLIVCLWLVFELLSTFDKGVPVPYIDSDNAYVTTPNVNEKASILLGVSNFFLKNKTLSILIFGMILSAPALLFVSYMLVAWEKNKHLSLLVHFRQSVLLYGSLVAFSGYSFFRCLYYSVFLQKFPVSCMNAKLLPVMAAVIFLAIIINFILVLYMIKKQQTIFP